MKTPLLSILIPTKDRYYYLKSCLASLYTSFNDSDIEIVITDNSSIREDLSECINSFNNIKYAYIDKPVSQVENFEFALTIATGKFVTMIGDDDGISGVIVDVVRYMDRNSIDALNSPFVTYFWPDIVSNSRATKISGKIFFKGYSFKITKVNSQAEINKCLNLGATSLCNLPRMYYGVIRRDILEQVKLLTGEFFPGPSPDMANAFSASLFVDSFVYFDAPLFIAGNSVKSAAGQGLAGKHVGRIEGNPQLPSDCHLHWTTLVPKYWSGPTIWAESAVKVIIKSNRKDLYLKMNFLRLYASCLIFNPEYKSVVLDAMNIYRKERVRNIAIKLQLEFGKVWLLRIKFFLKNILYKLDFFQRYRLSGIENIQIASDKLVKFDAGIKKAVL